MPESQKYIYYAAGENVSAIDHLPQTELLKDKNYEILYLTGETDEFVLQMLGKYADKEFRSIVDGELDLGEFGRIHFIDWDQTRARKRTVQVMLIGE